MYETNQINHGIGTEYSSRSTIFSCRCSIRAFSLLTMQSTVGHRDVVKKVQH